MDDIFLEKRIFDRIMGVRAGIARSVPLLYKVPIRKIRSCNLRPVSNKASPAIKNLILTSFFISNILSNNSALLLRIKTRTRGDAYSETMNDCSKRLGYCQENHNPLFQYRPVTDHFKMNKQLVKDKGPI